MYWKIVAVLLGLLMIGATWNAIFSVATGHSLATWLWRVQAVLCCLGMLYVADRKIWKGEA